MRSIQWWQSDYKGIFRWLHHDTPVYGKSIIWSWQARLQKLGEMQQEGVSEIWPQIKVVWVIFLIGKKSRMINFSHCLDMNIKHGFTSGRKMVRLKEVVPAEGTSLLLWAECGWTRANGIYSVSNMQHMTRTPPLHFFVVAFGFVFSFFILLFCCGIITPHGEMPSGILCTCTQ